MPTVRLLLAATVLSLLVLAACGDDATAPATRTDLTADQAQDWSASALGMVDLMIADVPAIADGTLTTLGPAKAAGAPTWDAGEMAWTCEATLSLDDGQGTTGELTYAYWVQYRNDAGPLPGALGATEIEFRLVEDMTMDSTSDQGTGSVDYEMATTLLVGYGDGVYTVDGDGSATAAVSHTAGGRTQTADVAMDWGVDLVQPPVGCPAGTVWIETPPYRMDAVYDGQGNVAWTFIGPSATASGDDVLACGP